jgi:uncharacterized cupin superfamily protein
MPDPSVKYHVPTVGLESMPFQPEQILAGDPVPSALITWQPDADKLKRAGIWESTPGTFDYKQEPDEMSAFVFISGSAVITPEGQEPMECGPGDVTLFPAGTNTVWEVRESIRVFYHVDSAV